MFTDDMIWYLKVSKDLIGKLLDLMNTFSQVVEYKINI